MTLSISSGKMRDLELLYLLLLSIFVLAISGQAPGDEEEFCFTLPNRPSYTDQIVLMSSRNYRNLIEGEGQWIVVDEDNNNGSTLTTVSDEMFGVSIDRIFGEYTIYGVSMHVYFYFSGRRQDQLVAGLLMCADLKQDHRITG